jgi:S-formylglutathione hydrolase FrmB
MALISARFFSHSLMVSSEVFVILPQPGTWQSGIPATRWPTLWLLHGLSDDHTIWQRKTSIERYVEPLPLAVVMPAVDRSFYQDMRYGPAYWTYLTEELPAIMRSMFPLSARRSDNFVAGLSMGGYGAYKVALNLPDRYAAAASLSGALDHAHSSEDPEWQRIGQLVYGSFEDVQGTDADLFEVSAQLAAGKTRPPALYQWCGTEDFLYDQNVRFHKHAQQIGLEVTYEEGPGDHSWGYWDAQIQRVLAWLPLRKEV